MGFTQSVAFVGVITVQFAFPGDQGQDNIFRTFQEAVGQRFDLHPDTGDALVHEDGMFQFGVILAVLSAAVQAVGHFDRVVGWTFTTDDEESGITTLCRFGEGEGSWLHLVLRCFVFRTIGIALSVAVAISVVSGVVGFVVIFVAFHVSIDVYVGQQGGFCGFRIFGVHGDDGWFFFGQHVEHMRL